MDGIKLTFGAVVAVAVMATGYAIYGEVAEPDSGRIIAKDHHAAWTQITCGGTPLQCSTIYHPECWEIRYADGDESGDACVTEDAYRRHEVGGWYPERAR